MTEPIMELIDVHGPFAGQLRPYAQTAGQNALDTGYAVRPEEYETEPAGTPLPADFPSAEHLVAAGFGTVESVPTTRKALEAISGIGPRSAEKVLEALGAGGE